MMVCFILIFMRILSSHRIKLMSRCAFHFICIVSPVLDDQFDSDSDFQIVDHKTFEIPMELLKDQILKFENSDIFFLEIIETFGQKEIKTDTRIAVEVKQVCYIVCNYLYARLNTTTNIL